MTERRRTWKTRPWNGWKHGATRRPNGYRSSREATPSKSRSESARNATSSERTATSPTGTTNSAGSPKTSSTRFLPPGIEHDRYIAMTNMTGFDDEIKEWSANWNDPGYWHDAAADALWSSNDGAYWTTRDEDPSDAVMARATAASQIALELDADNLIERTPENIGLLHDIVDTVHGMDPESVPRILPRLPVRNRPRNRRRASHRWRDREKTMYGGWNPDRDRYLRVNKDGDWVGMDQTTADRLVWDNRTPILKSVGAYADDMPADLTDRVCVMDERSSAARVKAPDPVDRRRLGRLVPSQRADHSRSDPGIDPNSGNGPMDPGIGM